MFKIQHNIVLDSMILDSDLSVKFFELCDFKMENPELKLLYRGSRDGFRGAIFHSKCDNRANTVTVIKTTLGFIFGGYSQAIWMANNQHGYDANAYLFSLVNPFKKPFLSHIVNPNFAIYNYSNIGPSFGAGSDIYICDKPNTSANNNVSLLHYQKPKNIQDSNGFYFCDNRNFIVKEIEVFQIENNY